MARRPAITCGATGVLETIRRPSPGRPCALSPAVVLVGGCSQARPAVSVFEKTMKGPRACPDSSSAGGVSIALPQRAVEQVALARLCPWSPRTRRWSRRSCRRGRAPEKARPHGFGRKADGRLVAVDHRGASHRADTGRLRGHAVTVVGAGPGLKSTVTPSRGAVAGSTKYAGACGPRGHGPAAWGAAAGIPGPFRA